MGALRFIELGNGKRVAEHDSAGDPLNPRWEAVYPIEEFDGKTMVRCRIIAHADEWEVGITENGQVMLGAGEGRVYSMSGEAAEKIAGLLEPVILAARERREEWSRGRVADDLQ
jgi:hypothetical protein